MSDDDIKMDASMEKELGDDPESEEDERQSEDEEDMV